MKISTNYINEPMNTRIFHTLLVLLMVWVTLPMMAQQLSVEPRAVKGGRVTLTFRNVPSEDAGNVNGAYTVNHGDGTISLPYLSDRVRVVGKTAREIEDHVRALYINQKIYAQPIVMAAVGSEHESNDLNQRYIQVTGNVAGKKNLLYRQGITLIQALLDCGDITDYGSRKIQVTRKGVTRTYDYFSARDRSIQLMPDDVIYVPTRPAFERRPSKIGP